jgi:hypothetical protein
VLIIVQRLVPVYPHSGQWMDHCGGQLVRQTDGLESISSDPQSGQAMPFLTGPVVKVRACLLWSSRDVRVISE